VKTAFGPQPCYRLVAPRTFGSLQEHAGSKGRISELARQLGVNRTTLRKWLSGANVAPYEMKLKIAAALGLPVEKCFTASYEAATYYGPGGGGRKR